MALARCIHLGFYIPCIMAMLAYARCSNEMPNAPIPLDPEATRSSIASGDRRSSVLMVDRQNLDMLLDVYLSLAEAAQKLEFLIQGSNTVHQPRRKKRQNNGGSDERYNMNKWEFMRFGK